MNDITKRREAYARIRGYIQIHRKTLREGGNTPDNIFPNMEAYLGKSVPDWTLDDFKKLEDAVKSEVEIITESWRRNPLWKRSLSHEEVVNLS